MTLTIGWERLDSLLADGLEILAAANFLEVGIDHDAVPLAVDWGHLKGLEHAGSYWVISARLGNRLVGYNAFFMNRHTRHRYTVYAVNDVIYLAREERRGGAGLRFLRESDRLLKEAGAIKAQYGVKLHVRLGVSKGTLGDVLARLGYRHTEEIYTKVM